MRHGATILTIIEAALQGETEKLRGYVELLASDVREDGETYLADSLLRILEGKQGEGFHLTAAERAYKAVEERYPGIYPKRTDAS